MASDELSLFSYEVLSLVGNTGAGAHDLARMVQRGRALAWAGESQYYVEPKRLARLGYLVARKEPGKTRQRTVYELTDKGREALVAWARTPVHFQPFKSELLPHRRKYLLMVNAHLRELLDLHLRWIDEIERELRPAGA